MHQRVDKFHCEESLNVRKNTTLDDEIKRSSIIHFDVL